MPKSDIGGTNGKGVEEKERWKKKMLEENHGGFEKIAVPYQ